MPRYRGKVKGLNMTLPFDGAISKFYEETAPDEVRAAIREGGKKDILSPT